MSYGESAVGLSFNPSDNPQVEQVKIVYAQIIDLLNDAQNGIDDAEHDRLYQVAITEAQTAQMWSVKAITWRG